MSVDNQYFKDKNIIITGAGNGLGKELAIQCVENGAHVVLVSTTRENLRKLQSVLPNASSAIFQCDIGDVGQVEETFANIEQKYNGEIHGLMNCVGVAGPTKPFYEVSDEEFEKVVDVNVKGIGLTTKRSIEMMVENEVPGNIMLFSSIAAMLEYEYPNRTAYTTSKAFAENLTLDLARNREIYRKNISVNCVRLPLFEGDRLDNVISAKSQDSGKEEEVIRRNMLRSYPFAQEKFPSVELIAKRVISLYEMASSESEWRLSGNIDSSLVGFYKP